MKFYPRLFEFEDLRRIEENQNYLVDPKGYFIELGEEHHLEYLLGQEKYFDVLTEEDEDFDVDAFWEQIFEEGWIRINLQPNIYNGYNLDLNGKDLEKIKDTVRDHFIQRFKHGNNYIKIIEETGMYKQTHFFNLPKDKEKFTKFIFEGVADEYADNEFSIYNEHIKDFEKKFLREQSKGLVGVIELNWEGVKLKYPTRIFKNPPNLNYFEPFVRGVILKNGDLYLADISKNVIHIDIIKFLINKNIIKGPTDIDDLETFVISENDYPRQFICVHRVQNKNVFGLGESSTITLQNMAFINAAEKKNPNYKFGNRDVFTLIQSLRQD